MILLFSIVLFGLMTASAEPTQHEARQLPFAQQPHESYVMVPASGNLWDHIDTLELEKQLVSWHNGSAVEPFGGNAINPARQGYPGSPGGGSEIPRPIPPYPTRPTHKPPVLPQGCLAPRGQFPSAKSCAHYLNCWDGVVVEQECPNGLLFNARSHQCDFAYNVQCGNRPTPPPHKPTLPPGSKHCPDPNGRYRSSTNCSEFYVCVGGHPIKFHCPRGLVYNDELGVCDYPYNVDCQGAAVPPPWHPEPEPTRPPHHPPTHPPTHPTPPPYHPTHPPHYPPTPTHPPTHPTPPLYDHTHPPHYHDHTHPPHYPPHTHYPTQPPHYPPAPTHPTSPPYYPTQPPHYPPPQPYPTQPPNPSNPYPINPWLSEARVETDPWHQRPAASELEILKNKEQLESVQQRPGDISTQILQQQDEPQKPALLSPWGQVLAIPAQLTKVPCNDGDVHRLTDSCSSVVVCRGGRPQLVQCTSGQIYDRPSDSCRHFTIAKC